MAIPISPTSIRRWTCAAAAVIGNGNVALDVARILAKTRAEFAGSDIVGRALDALEGSAIRTIHVLGRRGPHQIAMTPKELGELGHLEAAAPERRPRRFPAARPTTPCSSRGCASRSPICATSPNLPRPARAKTIDFDFFAMPVAIEGEGRVERLIVERTELTADLRSVGTGEPYAIDCGLVVSCIGYQTPPIEGVPYEHGRGRFANRRSDGDRRRPLLRRLGPARADRDDRHQPPRRLRGRRDDPHRFPARRRRQARAALGLDTLLHARGVEPVAFRDWQRIEAAETGRAREGSPREKFTSIAEMIAALGR